MSRRLCGRACVRVYTWTPEGERESKTKVNTEKDCGSGEKQLGWKSWKMAENAARDQSHEMAEVTEWSCASTRV